MQPVWSNRTLHAILERHVSRAERVALLDWHTGMGGFGETFFCCFHDREGQAFARAAQWWGREAVLGGDVGAGLPAPDYKGLLFNGVVEALGNTPVTGSVIEFGTYPLPEMAKALMVDQWLKFGAGQDSERDEWHNWMLERFCPASPDWREAVIEKANDTQRRMIEGLAAWR